MSSLTRKIHNYFHPPLGRVLMLHRVVEHIGAYPESARLEVTPGFLSEVLDAYREMGVDFIGIGQVAERIRAKKLTYFVCLTFDDGYLDTFTLAYPLLKERQIPFCVYLTRDFYQGKAKPHWNPDAEMMGEEQVKELASDPLCTIGAHTCTHLHLGDLRPDSQQYEIASGKDDLEQFLGRSVRHFAYPYGDYNKETLKIVRELGFETAVTTSGRQVRDDSRLLELDRVTFSES